MKSRRQIVLLLMVSLGLCQSPAFGEGWSWGRLNPFAEKSTEKSSSNRSSSSRTSMLDGKPINSRSAPEKPSMLERMGTGTKNFLGKTRDALTFKSEPAKKKGDGQHVTWDQPTTIKKKRPEPKSSGFFSWFKREEPRPSATVDEFLSSPRPESQF